MNRIAAVAVVVFLSSCGPVKAGDPCGALDEWKASSCDGAEWLVCTPARKFAATGCTGCATENGVSRCIQGIQPDEVWGLPGQSCDPEVTLGYCAGTFMVTCESGTFIALACSAACTANNIGLTCPQE